MVGKLRSGSQVIRALANARTSTVRALTSQPNADAGQDATGKWKILSWRQGLLISGITFAGGIIVDSYLRKFVDWTVATASPEERAADAILKSTVALEAEPDEFVERKGVTQPIQSFMDMKTGGSYMVVVGPRGCGKSTATQAAVQGKEGVIQITVAETGTVVTRIEETLNVDDFNVKNEHVLADVIKLAVDKRKPHDPLWRPTVVCETDRTTTDIVVNSAAKELKRLGTDKAAVHAILVLSDANAAFALPNDPRQDFLWVEDFTIQESDEYFNKRQFLVPSDHTNDSDPMVVKRHEFYQKVGTRPVDLRRAADRGESRIDDYIAEKELAAEEAVGGLMSYMPPANDVGRKLDGKAFERLMRDLLKTTDDVGVPRAETEEYLAPPAFASKIFKQQGLHAVLYHKPTATYRFHSPAHRRAAERRFLASGEAKEKDSNVPWWWPF